MNRSTLPKTWIFFFVIVLVLFVGAYLQGKSNAEQQPDLSGASDEAALPPSREANADLMLQNGASAVYVKDQEAGQASVNIGYAVFSEPGFIVVKKDAQGMPGEVVGVSGLLQNRVDDHRVALTASLETDQVYYAELVTDNGTGAYEEGVDRSVLDARDSVVLMSFYAHAQIVSTAP